MIYWLASYPKSGNTWARLLLTAYHHDGHCNINDTVTTGDVADHYYQAATIRPLPSLSGQEKVLLRYAALLNLMACTRHRPLVVKTHYANIEAWGVRLIPPMLTARAIYIVRDPRDVAPSFAAHMGKPVDEIVDDMANEHHAIGHDGKVAHIISTWTNHVRSWGAGDPEVTLVRYEDMKRDPGDALERMLVTFNVRPDAERIDRAVEATRLARLQQQESDRGFIEASKQAVRFFGGQHEPLTEAQRNQIENDHGEMMAQLGY